MNFNFPAYPILERTAQALDDLTAELVFIGGAVIGLYMTEVQVREVRVTEDVDVICEALTYAELHRFDDLLRARGFVEAIDSNVICRWKKDELIVDVMPLAESVLGFSNRWYSVAFDTSESATLPTGITIRVPTAPALIACKMDAFNDRGRGDFLASKDFEDIVLLLDGRPALIAEVPDAEQELRQFVGDQMREWLADERCVESIAGHLPPDPASQGRRAFILDRMRQIAEAV